MSSIRDAGSPDLTTRIAGRIRELRAASGYSLDVLAAKSGVSRSAISMIERGTTSPTAVVLEKLATALDVPLASLFEPSPGTGVPRPVVRRPDQVTWRDPGSGYVRRDISPPGWPSPIRIIDVRFPAGATVAYETAQRDITIHQQVWSLSGAIEVTYGDETHHLAAGDCLAMRVDRPISFHNPTGRAVRYAVVLVSEPPPARRSA